MFYLTKEIAKDLEALVHPDVEEALLKLLNYIESAEKDVLYDTEASIEALKLYQGKFLVLNGLKQYKQRIFDAIQG